MSRSWSNHPLVRYLRPLAVLSVLIAALVVSMEPRTVVRPSLTPLQAEAVAGDVSAEAIPPVPGLPIWADDGPALPDAPPIPGCIYIADYREVGALPYRGYVCPLTATVTPETQLPAGTHWELISCPFAEQFAPATTCVYLTPDNGVPHLSAWLIKHRPFLTNAF